MKSRWARIEGRMETLIEGTFTRLFARRLHPRDLSVHLARALEDSAAGGSPAIRYLVYLHPEDAQILLGDQPRLAEVLAEELVNMAREANLMLTREPEVILRPEAKLKPRSVRVTAVSD